MRRYPTRQRLIDGSVVNQSGCWLWNLTKNRNGYAQITIGRPKAAHRVSYEAFIGPIPEGLQLDHLCRVRHCVNPWHLEPVTQRENTMRGETIPASKAAQTHCIHGHPFDEANTYVWIRNGHPQRGCRACNREVQRRKRSVLR